MTIEIFSDDFLEDILQILNEGCQCTTRGIIDHWNSFDRRSNIWNFESDPDQTITEYVRCKCEVEKLMDKLIIDMISCKIWLIIQIKWKDVERCEVQMKSRETRYLKNVILPQKSANVRKFWDRLNSKLYEKSMKNFLWLLIFFLIKWSNQRLQYNSRTSKSITDITF